MKIAHISGTNYNEFSNLGNINFCLAHQVLENHIYASFYRNQNKYLILDNSAAEKGESVDFKSLLEAIRIVQPKEFWLPDKLYDCDVTLDWTRRFIKILKNEGLLENMNLVGLAQGKTRAQWLYCYKEMLKIPEIQVMGISKYSVECFNCLAGTKTFSICRKECIRYLYDNKLIQKSLHCAGGNHLLIDEIQYYKRHPEFKVRSMDTNLAFKLGIHQIKIEDCTTEPEARLNHNIKNLNSNQLLIIKHNISLINERIRC